MEKFLSARNPTLSATLTGCLPTQESQSKWPYATGAITRFCVIFGRKFVSLPKSFYMKRVLSVLIADSKNSDSKVRFTKNTKGTYDCQVFWIKDSIDPSTGKPWLDFRNPDKSARNVRCDQLYIIKGLKYDAAAKIWNGAKIYDPNRGISANVKCRFAPDGSLEVKGTVLGIGETMYWEKLK